MEFGIRKLYQPVQPTVSQSMEEEIAYLEFAPHPSLQQIIYCYWQLKTKQPLQSDFSYRVVADGCIDILLELNQPQDNFITGLSTSYTEFSLASSFNYIGIRFLPTGFPQLFKVDASLLTNQFESLDSLLPHTARYLATRLNSEQSIEAIRMILDTHFQEVFSKRQLVSDHRVFEALEIILKNRGVVDIQSLSTGLSPRQLRRLFHFYLGESAKTFSKVVRFQHILQAKPSNQSLKEDKIFYDVGYYDQAHFIKEFKHLYGVTPAKAFRK